MNINNLISALSTLQSGYAQFQNNKDLNIKDMLADSCVKRFEYTIETAIKLMRKFLKQIYFIDEKDLTINNIFRLMEGYEFINSWESWKNYYQRRNDTSHEYNIEKSRELINLIPQFMQDISFLVKNLEKALLNNDNN